MKTLVTRRRLLLALTATAVYPGALFDEVASAACIPHEDASNHAADQVKGLLGRWRSTVFRRGLLLEWGDASGCELIISDKARLSAEEKLEIGQIENISGVAALPNSPYVIRLYLSNGGETWLAPDAMPGWLAPGRASVSVPWVAIWYSPTASMRVCWH